MTKAKRVELRRRNSFWLLVILAITLPGVWGCGGGGGGEDQVVPASVDQEYWPTPLPTLGYIVDVNDIAQVFTAGRTGVLTRVDVMAMNTLDGPVTFDLRPAPGGVPHMDSGTKYVSVGFQTSAEMTTGTYSEFSLTLNPGIPVTAGETYAICFSSDGGACNLLTSDPGTYGGGSPHFRVRQTPAVAWVTDGTRVLDILFRTWVTP